MNEKDIQTLKDAVWLIEKLTGHLGIDLNELEENYNNSLQELEEMISRNE
ncbi:MULTISPECIES: hypothetical protein [unclassified Sporosarcina]|nr:MULTISPECIES: hypothetical protein [unclassified Sporosarcina]